MQFDHIYVDTNIFIRAFEGAPDDKITQDLVAMFGSVQNSNQAPFVTSQISLAETLIHPIRHNDPQTQLRYKILLSRSSNWLQVRQISLPVLLRAANLRATINMKLPDAIHAATAILSDCSHILTADADFKLADDKAPGLPSILKPDAETLAAIISWLRT